LCFNIQQIKAGTMKKLLSFLTLIILFQMLHSQNWTPIGATWHYTEKFSFWHVYDEDYIKFESVKDTMMMGKNCRKITKRHKLVCNDRPLNEFMYQENGKVYFYDPHFEAFQVLYDFSANQFDSWTILVKDDPLRNVDTLTIVVDSTDMVNINGTDLKQLYITYWFIYDYFDEGNIDTMIYHSRIIERIGDVQYMFNYAPVWSFTCDGNYTNGLRCYEDTIVGLHETGLAESCDYRHHFLQDLMTVREVFDFEVGDIFHFRGEADDQLPNADRITIMDKYFSADADTLFYIRFHDSYYAEEIMDPPFLEYHYLKETDTVFYTDLDTTLMFYDRGCQTDFSYYYSKDLCDSLINSCTRFAGPESEDEMFSNRYGRGLGKVYSFKLDVATQSVLEKNYLFYFKKSSGHCGIPDTIVSIGDFYSTENQLILFPNPTNRYLTVQSADRDLIIERVQLFDLAGRELKINVNDKQIDLRDLPKGMYLIRLKLSGWQIVIQKVVLKR